MLSLTRTLDAHDIQHTALDNDHHDDADDDDEKRWVKKKNSKKITNVAESNTKNHKTQRISHFLEYHFCHPYFQEELTV